MPHYRVEIRSSGTWTTLAAIEQESAAQAVEAVRAALPRRCEGEKVRAVEIRPWPSRENAAVR